MERAVYFFTFCKYGIQYIQPQVFFLLYGDGDEHKFIEGDILIYMKVNGIMTYRRIGRCGYMSVGVPCIAHPENYPKIFQPLPWYAERAVEDMPDYVRLNPENTVGGDEVFKVLSVKKFVDGIGILISKLKHEGQHIGAKYFIPATQSDYEAYIKTQTP